MVTGKIRFTTVDDVKNFVNKVSKYGTDIDIKYRTTVLDGKSFQGLVSIQLQVDLTCEIHDSLDNCKDIITDIKEYTIEEFK